MKLIKLTQKRIKATNRPGGFSPLYSVIFINPEFIEQITIGDDTEIKIHGVERVVIVKETVDLVIKMIEELK